MFWKKKSSQTTSLDARGQSGDTILEQKNSVHVESDSMELSFSCHLDPDLGVSNRNTLNELVALLMSSTKQMHKKEKEDKLLNMANTF